MIHVQLDTSKFLELLGRKFYAWEARAQKATDEMGKAGRLVRFDLKLLSDIKPALRAMFHGKCAYCESNVEATGHGDIENYRPKRIYPLLTYELSNLLYTCAICNQRYKRDQFPLIGESPAGGVGGRFERRDRPIFDIYDEKPLLLNPYFDQPQEHLAFGEDDKLREVRVTGLTERGRVSIDVLGLNRPELLLQRYHTWAQVRMFINALASAKLTQPLKKDLAAELKKALDDSAVYAGAVRQLCRARMEKTQVKGKGKRLWGLFNDFLEENTIHVSEELQQSAEQEQEAAREVLSAYSVEDNAQEVTDKFNYAAKRIDRIEIKNLRSIPRLDLTFPAMAERESWIMLIGENGAGKSTILQGVALALMGERRANGYGLNASQFVRRGTRAGFVRVHINAVGSITLHFAEGSEKFRVDPPEPKVPLLAYGPTRLLPSETEHPPLSDRNIRTDNLFKPTVPLSDADIWLADTWKEDEEAFRSVGRALCRLLSISERTPPRLRDGRVEIKMPDGWRRISDLSAGYRSVLALVVDIAIGTSGKRRRVEDAVGIVLLDEIEMHLHPAWKIQIVERLRDVFPQLSFLATTHDPLCLKGLYDREIAVLRRGPSGAVTVATDLPSVDALKTDEILTSKELFELPSSRNHASPVTIARYSALLKRPSLTVAEKRELARLQQLITEMLSGALTPMQREVERAVSAVMKELRTGNDDDAKLTEDVVAEIHRQVSDIGGEP
jgi:uncharacterized protein (TIGR02646 family)